MRDAHEIQFQHFGFAVAGDFAILSVDRHKATEARVDACNASGGLFEHRPELPFACMQCGVLCLQSRSHVIERRADLGEFVAATRVDAGIEPSFAERAGSGGEMRRAPEPEQVQQHRQDQCAAENHQRVAPQFSPAQLKPLRERQA